MGGLGDLRQIGSGNIGATNVLRTGNKGLAALTLIPRCAQGHDGGADRPAQWGYDLALIAGLFAFLGHHSFPVWLGFSRRQGVATYLGVLAPIVWQAALAFAAAWLLVAAVMRYSSLAALVAAVVAPLALFGLGHVDAAVLFALMTVIIYFKHSQNISRLLNGTESRIGSKG